MTAARGQRGLTLVELIVAMTVTVLVAGSTVGVLRSVAGARQRVEREMALQQEAGGAARVIVAALRSAVRTTADDGLLEGTPAWQGDVPADRIRFFTVGEGTLRPDQPESDVRECEFFLGKVEGEDLPVLLRRLDPTRNDPPRGGGILQRLAGNVVALAFAYHDGTQWQDRWAESSRDWPEAVRVELMVADPKNPGAAWSVCRIVNFPCRALPQPGEAAKPAAPEKAPGAEEPSGPGEARK